MKITIISGQNHKGSTYTIARKLADKIGGEITEFFLPRDFGDFCVGCTQCFMKGEENCPHHEKLQVIVNAMLEADVIIFASPVYVYHVTGPMKSFLDHLGYLWMIHRPREGMFKKQAVCISTAAGGGTKSTNKDIYDSCFYWGIPKIYQLGYNVRATSYKEIPEKIILKMEADTDRLANKIRSNTKTRVGIKTRGMFGVMRMLHKKGLMSPSDRAYWKEKGWLEKQRPWQ